jgi:molybdopterin molybdotransferase
VAQLTDDCFAFGGPMMPVEEAARQIAARLHAVDGTESVGLAAADGRFLARGLVAPLPLPPFTNSAVDGYAVRAEDLPASGERALALGGRLQAGSPPPAAIPPHHAVRIFTGAPMPDGFGTVFMQEDVRLDEAGRVVLPAGLKRGANVRPAGEDFPAGAAVLPAGHRLRPQDVALAAALGLEDVEVRRRIRVAVFSTGNEIVAPGAPRGPAQIHDSNRFMLIAMLSRLGCSVTDLGILPDDAAAIAGRLDEAAESHDLVMASGGVSTGEADFVKAAVEAVGSLVFWRVAIKPGRPVAMGVIRGTAFMGLPGNPVASFVTFTYVVRPMVLVLAGGSAGDADAAPVQLRAAFAYRKKAGRREYVRVHVKKAGDGALEAVKFPREGAGLISSLVDCDGLVELGEDVLDVAPGQSVRFFAWPMLA